MSGDAPESILILHTGALGDCVLTAQVAACLQRAYAGATVAMAARNPIATWFAQRGCLDRAFSLESLALHGLYRDDGEASLPGPLESHELIVSFLGGPEAPVSRNLARLKPGRTIAVDPAYRGHESKRVHITSQWLADLRGAGLDVPATPPATALIERERCPASSRPPRHVIVHPGSGGKAKCAPLDRLEEVVRALRVTGLNVTWMIGPAEREWSGQPYVDRLRHSADVIEERDVCRATDTLMHFDAFVGHDAGMTHLAAALGLRTVALFGPTDPVVWRPLGPDVHVLHFSGENSDSGKLGDRIVGCFAECFRRGTTDRAATLNGERDQGGSVNKAGA